MNNPEGWTVSMFVGTEPPQEAPTNLWYDISCGVNNAVLKYFDGDEWCRMDGGGSIPDGMIIPRMFSPDLLKTLEDNQRDIFNMQRSIDALATGLNELSNDD